MTTLIARLLNGTAIYRAPDDEKGSAAPEPTEAEKNAARVKTERESIKVTTGKATEQDEDEDKDEDDGDEKDEDNKDDKTDDEKDDKDEDEGNKNDEDEEKEKTAAADEENDVEKLKKQIERLKKRVGKTTAEKTKIASDLEQARADLAKKKEDEGEILTEDEVNKRATKLAAEKNAQDAFDAACDRLSKKATKLDKEFDSKVAEMAEEVAPIPGAMIGILDDLDNGAEVLVHLTENTDEYEKLIALPPAKMGVALAKLSTKIEKPQRKLSSAPDPITPNSGNRPSATTKDLRDTKGLNTKDWIKERERQLAEKRRREREAYS
jgi:hypothetical protein